MKTITYELSEQSIDQAIQEIKEFQADLKRKYEKFVEELMNEGITVAQRAVRGSEYGDYITFEKQFKNPKSGIIAIMLMKPTGIVQSEWLQKDGSTKVANVSPTLMVEFGSGRYAQNPKAVPGVGRGTFPGQTHADEPGWWYATGTPENKTWHYSSGVMPDQPMFKAANEMRYAIRKVAQRCFK